MNLNTARKALRESRTISLRRSLEASTVSPNISLDMDARASAAQEAVDAVDSTDLESALLLPRQQGNPQGSAGAPPGGSPRLGAEASGDCERQSSARSLTGPEYQAHRDSRALWRLARTNLGACMCLVASHGPASAGRQPLLGAASFWGACCGWELAGQHAAVAP